MSAPQMLRPLPVFNGLNAPPVRPVDWLIPGFLARGAGTILFGQPGVKKTVHVAHLCACLVAGVPFAGFHSSGKKLRVLYMDFDSSWDWNAELFAAAFRGVGVEGIPEMFSYYSPGTPECQYPDEPDAPLRTLEQLGPEIAATVEALRADVVVCDSLGQMMAGDTNSGQDVALALRLGLNPARKAGAGVLVIDHAAKAAMGGFGVPTPMGSQQKRAWARVTVAIEADKQDGEPITRWSMDKTNAAPFEPFHTRAHFHSDSAGRLETLRLDFIGVAGPRAQQRKETRGEQAQAEILARLAQGPAQRGDFPRDNTYETALRKLIETGQAVKVAHGQYALPDQSEAAEFAPLHRSLGDGALVQDEGEDLTW